MAILRSGFRKFREKEEWWENVHACIYGVRERHLWEGTQLVRACFAEKGIGLYSAGCPAEKKCLAFILLSGSILREGEVATRQTSFVLLFLCPVNSKYCQQKSGPAHRLHFVNCFLFWPSFDSVTLSFHNSTSICFSSCKESIDDLLFFCNESMNTRLVTFSVIVL